MARPELSAPAEALAAAYAVPTAPRRRAVHAGRLALSAVAAVWLAADGADIGALCADPEGADCGRLQTAIWMAVAGVLLIALPLGVTGMLGERRRGGLAILADEYELRFGAGGRWEGPVAWHRIARLRLDRGLFGPRIGIDLLDVSSIVVDFGRPLGPIEDWRMKRGGPMLTIAGDCLAEPVAEVHARLVRLKEAGR